MHASGRLICTERAKDSQDAVVRYLTMKSKLRSFRDVQRICRMLDAYLGQLMLRRSTAT